jgi:acetoin utilization protein AcuB
MFVSMWMTRELITVSSTLPLSGIARLMAEKRIRRVPVTAAQDSTQLLGIVSHSDVLHAFPARLNPFSPSATEELAALEQSSAKRVTAADLMQRDPHTTAPDAPLESAARLMRQHKIGALPVVKGQALVGMITESDIFRAMVELFEARERAVRITFGVNADEDVLPLVAEIARRRNLRVTSFMALPRHDPPVCVAQLAGEHIEAALEDLWNSKHRVMNVVHLP